MHTKTRTRRDAFTLLEILIVIGILVLLAAFVVPSLMSRSDEAKIGLVQTEIGRNGPIAGALKMYRLHVGTYPDADEGLASLMERPDNIDDDSDIWKGPYLDMRPEELKDTWGEEYIYECCPGKMNEDGYDLYSKGPDRKEGTDDDIGNWPKK